MDIGVIGGGINGLCCAWHLAKEGHHVRLYERDTIMSATSRSSSKLLHGGLRYLENGEFRLVREALRERDAWIRRVPELTNPLRLVMPLYRGSHRHRLVVKGGLFVYDRLAGKSELPPSKWLSRDALLDRSPGLNGNGLVGGYEFSDGQMDDYALGLWVAEQAKHCGVNILENSGVARVGIDGSLTMISGQNAHHDRVLNIAGPWATDLLRKSGISTNLELDLVRGSHLILDQPCQQSYLLEVPGERRIFFVLPWKGQTLLGTTEVRHSEDKPIECTSAEQKYLLDAYQHYWPASQPHVAQTFAGLRPLIRSAQNPSKATREYAIHRTESLITVLGGKWTTAMALARKISHILH